MVELQAEEYDDKSTDDSKDPNEKHYSFFGLAPANFIEFVIRIVRACFIHLL